MARQKILTKAQADCLALHDETVRRAINTIYRAAPDGRTDVAFSACYALASANKKEAYDYAVQQRHEYESKLISEGRGWYDSGRPRFYGPNAWR